MSTLYRFTGTRVELIRALLTRPTSRHDQLYGLSLARCPYSSSTTPSSVPPPPLASNPPPQPQSPPQTQNPNPKSGKGGLWLFIGSALALGGAGLGLGYAYGFFDETPTTKELPQVIPDFKALMQIKDNKPKSQPEVPVTPERNQQPEIIPVTPVPMPKMDNTPQPVLTPEVKTPEVGVETLMSKMDEKPKKEDQKTDYDKLLITDEKDLTPEKLKELKKFYEEELQKALARQSRVHHDNLELHKDLMRNDYERKFRQNADIKEAEQLVDIRYKYKQATAALAAMRKVLTDRKDQEERAQSSRKLWSVAGMLYNRINFSSPADPASTSIINTNKAKLIEEFSDDEFAVQLLKTIPDKLGSIENLRNRFFNKVDKTCRNLAVFRADEQKLSLGKYIMGYLQGSLVATCEGDKEDVKSVYEILDRTGYHLRRGELLEAVVTLNKTDGLPRKVCQDWLADARAALETSQTLVALMTHANAINQS